MLSSSFYYFWEYWNLFHKVTFDGPNKLILVNEGVTSLDWGQDVYSAWKEWLLLNSNKENPGFLPAIRVVGGDPIDESEGRFLGATFFLTNGWRLRTWSGNHRLVVNGNVFTEEGDPIDVPTLGNNNTVIQQTVSNLIDLVKVTGDVAAADLAEAVRTELSPELSRVDTTISSRASQSSVDSVANLLGAISQQIDVNLAGINDNADALQRIEVDTNDMLTVLSELKKFNFNRSKIDPGDKTLTIYDNDDVTPLIVFDLLDTSQQSSTDEVAEKVPR